MHPESGLVHLWQQGDLVIRAVAVLLLAMSLASWTVIAVKALDLRRARRQGRAVEGFWHARDFAEGLGKLGAEPANPYRALALEGREAADHRNAQPQLHDSLSATDWITRALRNAIDDTSARMQAGLALLASVGSTAPFVGLFGTVWGIYHALLAIGASGQAAIDQVAGPIGEALVMTALGLAVAIPAVLGYNALVRGNKALLFRLNRFANDLHAYLLTGARIGTGAAANVITLKKGA